MVISKIIPSSQATLCGQITLQGREETSGPSWVTPLAIKLMQGGTVVGSYTATTDEQGTFAISVPAGIYDVCIKSPRALSRKVSNVQLTAGWTTSVDFGTLLEGDANDDDVIALGDYSMLYAAYGSVPGDPNWDDRCDFNRNGAVDLGDYSLLYSNYGLTGDCYQE